MGLNQSDIFYSKLVRVILTEIRGARTQKQMSGRVGYRFNQWHKWESGQKILMWQDLLDITTELKIDLTTPIKVIADADLGSVQNGGLFVKKIFQKFGASDSQETLKKLKISRAALHRIVSLKNDVEVTFVLKCLGELSSLLPYLIGFLVKESKNNFLRKMVTQMNDQVHLEAAYPWFSAIEAFVDTNEYKKLKNHSDELIASELGISVAEARRGIQLLFENGVLIKQGERYKLNLDRIDLDESIEDSARFARFWTKICLNRSETPNCIPRSGKGWSSRVYAVSDAASEEIFKLRNKFVDDMAKVLLRDKGKSKTKVQVFILHLFDHHEFKELKLTNKNSQK